MTGANADRRSTGGRAGGRLAIVDAHHHVWDLVRNRHPWLQDRPPIAFRYGDYEPLRRSYSVADHRRAAGRFDIVGSVYVEAEWDPADPIGETRYIHEIADRDGLPTVMVAQAWLDREDAADILAGQAAFPRVRSVRQKPTAARDRRDAQRGAPGSMDCPLWRAGFSHLDVHRLRFDLQTPWWHFDAAADLARDFPRTPIIVNHAGLPADRSEEGLAGWRKALERIAAWPNTALKISGLGVPGERWTPELQGPVVRDAIRIFGARRCMFASNFPVDGLCGSFDEIFDAFDELTSELDEAVRADLFRDNARRIYAMG
jgi:predicted TIM-barrel fold metal-dependent hydrolase